MAKWRVTKKYLLFIPLLFLLIAPSCTANNHYRIVIVAGQSNAVGMYTSDASFTIPSADAQEIDFLANVNGFSSNGITSLSPHRTRETDVSYFGTDSWGAEATMAKRLNDYKCGNEKIMVVKVATVNTNLHTDWDPSNTSPDALYPRLTSNINDAITHVQNNFGTYEIDGMLWMQGESDVSFLSNQYENNLNNFRDQLRTDLNSPQLDFVIGRINFPDSDPIGRAAVRDAQQNVADSDVRTHLINTDPYNLPDNVHYDQGGIIELGNSTADKILDSQDSDSDGQSDLEEINSGQPHC